MPSQSEGWENLILLNPSSYCRFQISILNEIPTEQTALLLQNRNITNESSAFHSSIEY